jgi:hypothetical protein
MLRTQGFILIHDTSKHLPRGMGFGGVVLCDGKYMNGKELRLNSRSDTWGLATTDVGVSLG